MMGAKKKRLLWWFEEWQLEQQEAWLADMASQGWHLQSTGMLATFQQGAPQRMRYRCEVSGPDHLDEERREIYQAAGWEYVRRRGSLQIYRAPEDTSIPEIHTETGTQAQTLHHLLRPLSIYSVLFVGQLVLGYFLVREHSLVWMDLLLQSDFTALVAILALASFMIWNITGIGHLLRLMHRLRRGQPLNHQLPYRRVKSGNVTKFVAAVLILVLLVGGRIGRAVGAASRVSFPPIPAGELQVVRLADVLDPAGLPWERSDTAAYLQERAGGDVFNYFRTEKSLLVPTQVQLHERVVAGELPQEISLESHYYQARTPWLARQLAQQLLHLAPVVGLPRSADDPHTPRLVTEAADYTLWSYRDQECFEFVLLHDTDVYRVRYQGWITPEELLSQTVARAGVELMSD